MVEQNVVKNSKKFGFGCMRLPMQGENIDFEECNRMVDAFMEGDLLILILQKVILGAKVKSLSGSVL